MADHVSSATGSSDNAAPFNLLSVASDVLYRFDHLAEPTQGWGEESGYTVRRGNGSLLRTNRGTELTPNH